MLVWQRATTVRICHFFFVEKAYAVSFKFVASFSLTVPSLATSSAFAW
jgi:hypothetical protein